MIKIKIISLFDYTGNWSKPYKENGYEVIQVDIKHGIDILKWDYKSIPVNEVLGILAAIPCTDYALSGAKHFKYKDENGITQNSNLLVDKTKEIIEYFNPKFWVVENPMSRIHKLNPWLGNVKYKFNPCDFAGYGFEEEAYNKKTWLWGKFLEPITRRIEPKEKYFPGWRKYGGKSEKTKELRSVTPLGFSYAFYEANQARHYVEPISANVL